MKITHRLMLLLAVGLAAILAAQTATRLFIELPALRQLERLLDARAVDRARIAVAEQIYDLEREVDDYATWDATYEFMGRDPGDPKATYYIENEVGFTAHRNTRINGMLMVDNAGRVVHATHFDLRTGERGTEGLDFNDLDQAAFKARPRGNDPSLISSGLVSSNIGSVVYAAARILDAEEKQPARGMLVFWRLIDDDLIRDLGRITGAELELVSAVDVFNNPNLKPRLELLAAESAPFLPRDGQNNLYWAIFDFAERPLYLVRQSAGPRVFEDGAISRSSMAGFIGSGLVLLITTFMFSRWFVRRVTRATAVMREIQRSDEYRHTTPVQGNDELSEMFVHFNGLLEQIRTQDQDLKTQNRQLAEISQRDALPGSIIAGFSTRPSTGAGVSPPGPAAPYPSCSLPWITSRPSTTITAISAATACSSKWRRSCRTACTAPRTTLPGMAARNSASSLRTRVRITHCSWRRICARPSRNWGFGMNIPPVHRWSRSPSAWRPRPQRPKSLTWICSGRRTRRCISRRARGAIASGLSMHMGRRYRQNGVPASMRPGIGD